MNIVSVLANHADGDGGRIFSNVQDLTVRTIDAQGSFEIHIAGAGPRASDSIPSLAVEMWIPAPSGQSVHALLFVDDAQPSEVQIYRDDLVEERLYFDPSALVETHRESLT